VVDFLKKWTLKTELKIVLMLGWLGLGRSKYYDWEKRYGKANEQNKEVPRDQWLQKVEQEKIVKFYREYPLEGYRRLTYMMLDRGVVAVSPSSTYRVLKEAGLLERWKRNESKKGTGFVQPENPHEHWHVDITYLNLGGTFYYLCCVLDGCSRFIVHWDIAPSMTERDVEMVLQKAREKYPEAKPRIISDNGPQFIAKDFKEFIRLTGMTHVRTSPYYPQSNGKMERWNKSFKIEGWRPGLAGNEEEARALTEKYVRHYNEVRLHSAIGYITPKDKLEGREQEIWKQRDEQLENARKWRANQRRSAAAKKMVESLVAKWSVSSFN
jgi:putative transposase